MIEDKKNKVLKAFRNPLYWRPNFTQIRKDTDIPVSTLHDSYMKLYNKNSISVVIAIDEEIKEVPKEQLQKIEERLKAMHKLLYSIAGLDEEGY